MNRSRTALLLLVISVAMAWPAAAAPLLWRAVANAFLRVNDEGVKEWSVYQVEKKDDRFVLQIADRYLLIDPQRKLVFELVPADIAHDAADLLWDPAKTPAKPLATSTWLVRDVGFARRIKMRLDAEGRTLDLQIPHPYSRH